MSTIFDTPIATFNRFVAMVFHNICFQTKICFWQMPIAFAKKLTIDLILELLLCWSFIFFTSSFLEYYSFNTFPDERCVYLLTKVHRMFWITDIFRGFFSVERIPRMNKMSSNIYLVNGNLFVVIHRFVGILSNDRKPTTPTFWHCIYWTVSSTNRKRNTLV